MTTDTELSAISRTIDIAAPPERVWRALTDAADLGTWFQVRIEGDIAAGREVWMTSTQPGHNGVRFLVRFVELSPPRRLVWEWHPGEVDAAVDYSREPRTTVTFTLEPAGTGTRLTVDETGFDAITLARRAKVYKDNEQGWAEVLLWLQQHAQGPR
jgi:uncharacterized protein YndB with AHSA1/START domain